MGSTTHCTQQSMKQTLVFVLQKSFVTLVRSSCVSKAAELLNGRTSMCDFFSLKFILLVMCVHMHTMHTSVGSHVPSCSHGSQRIALRSHSLLPLWGPGMRLMPPGLCNKRLDPLSRLTSTRRRVFPLTSSTYCPHLVLCFKLHTPFSCATSHSLSHMESAVPIVFNTHSTYQGFFKAEL